MLSVVYTSLILFLQCITRFANLSFMMKSGGVTFNAVDYFHDINPDVHYYLFYEQHFSLINRIFCQ